uniref:Uncharacterized protein n=1 Tax=Craspedostauros australis TaxID=1486917 RepID=A0A6T6HPI0_9STRA|mmetsp:Transcript_6368/g.17337  ORF Transcript_6368/g.17337 Transcript_6368/m.17337 type:complete len:250 (+) Transcript_6368:228-977(+)|eukprot:CAMPEP_0198120986 /NCGR_PEP_ID=MMETSP1442-20131203/30894_1 /TAXON_ID= /ORGANISM="Craspedostauros australis, Strain CCMP3328" /LENGTH=249 /DNA_ID=CAMNT_0043779731 /DNA_START=155 /DNA_END=904 /DNA_ORIENTATION=-
MKTACFLSASLLCAQWNTHALSTPTAARPTVEASNLLTDRRGLFGSAAAAVAVAAGVAQQRETPLLADDSVTTTNRLGSIDEAVALIDQSCDRRFLHGVVASGYQMMYKLAPKSAQPSIVAVEHSAGVVLSQPVLDMLSGHPVPRPADSFLTWTDPEQARSWRNEVVSVWPLTNDAHFAWVEGGGTFSGSMDMSNRNIIVDGIDCGREALEDALEAEKSQILVQADRYLAVPLSMEKELIAKLQGSFLI